MTAARTSGMQRLPAGAGQFDLATVAAMVAAAVAALYLPRLPAPWLLLATTFAALSMLRWLRRARWLAWAMLAATWTLLHAHWAMQVRLPEHPTIHDVRLQVRIVGLPDRQPQVSRFDARVVAGALPATGVATELVGRHLRLAWYEDAPPMRPGERWELDLRLRAPRGVVNPGGFDFERHALQNRLAASGYVRLPATARRLQAAAGVNAWRDRIADAIGQLGPTDSSRFLRGLAVGDTRGMSDHDWELLRATGLSHLLAISGLHIGLVAGFGALLMRLLYRMAPLLAERWPRPLACAWAALAFAAAYSALAGWGLPTLRTLAMIAVALLGVLLRRRVSAGQSLALAALTMLLIDPLALLGAGFWLSFLGVAWLLLCLPAEAGMRAAARSLWLAQWAMALGLLPLTVAFFGQSSLVGVALNLFAVPWVNLVVVPLTLLGTLLLPWPALASVSLAAAGAAMDLLWWLAESSARWPWAQVFWPQPTMLAVLAALLAVAILLLPRGLPGKPLAALLLLPLLWPARAPIEDGAFEVDVLDVGQGLSVLLRTSGHSLLYDTGPAFRGGLDMGEAAVVPALRALGLQRLDRLIISHGDNDHAGGAAAVRRAFPSAEVFSGEPQRVRPAAACRAGQQWEWDGVRFRILHPGEHFPELGNESSCVLQIAGAGGSVLLPGDISSLIEQRLLRQGLAHADVLVAAHHGSRSASSAEFVGAVDPDWVVFASGHGNRFGHPHAEVRARFRQHGAQLLDSAGDGAITLFFPGDASGVQVQQWRDDARIWRSR